MDNLNEHKGMKFMVGAYVLFNKFSGETEIETKPYIITKVITVTNISEINMYEIYDKLLKNITSYQREGSGWIKNGVLSCEINVS